jgi:hypothetical protein
MLLARLKTQYSEHEVIPENQGRAPRLRRSLPPASNNPNEFFFYLTAASHNAYIFLQKKTNPTLHLRRGSRQDATRDRRLHYVLDVVRAALLRANHRNLPAVL